MPGGRGRKLELRMDAVTAVVIGSLGFFERGGMGGFSLATSAVA